jgi:hypothetical protein
MGTTYSEKREIYLLLFRKSNNYFLKSRSGSLFDDVGTNALMVVFKRMKKFRHLVRVKMRNEKSDEDANGGGVKRPSQPHCQLVSLVLIFDAVQQHSSRIVKAHHDCAAHHRIVQLPQTKPSRIEVF